MHKSHRATSVVAIVLLAALGGCANERAGDGDAGESVPNDTVSIDKVIAESDAVVWGRPTKVQDGQATVGNVEVLDGDPGEAPAESIIQLDLGPWSTPPSGRSQVFILKAVGDGWKLANDAGWALTKDDVQRSLAGGKAEAPGATIDQVGNALKSSDAFVAGSVMSDEGGVSGTLIVVDRVYRSSAVEPKVGDKVAVDADADWDLSNTRINGEFVLKADGPGSWTLEAPVAAFGRSELEALGLV